MAINSNLNTDSRTKNSVRNISLGIVGQLVQVLLGFTVRAIFVKYLAIEYLGVSGLFSSIIGVLSFAELGIGSALVYEFYKPLADKNERQVAAVLNYYRRIYVAIGLITLCMGMVLIPFLDHLIPEKPNIDDSINLIYVLYIINSASSYFFSYKVSLINADQRNYIQTLNYYTFYILQSILQICVLIVYQDYLLFLVIQIVCVLCSNFSISYIVNKVYPFLQNYKYEKLDVSVRKRIVNNGKAAFIRKIGGVLVNSTDNIIINYFSGLALVGYLSNYVLLISVTTSFIAQVFSNITSSIAQVNAKESIEKQNEIFSLVNFLNFWIYGFASVCIIILINDFIIIWLGKEFLLPISIVFIVAINFFILGMQGAVWTFKTTYGFFNEGKYLIILTAILNLVFSFYLGDKIGLLGILLATSISRCLTNVWYDPYIVFKKGLKKNPIFYLGKYFRYIIIIVIATSVIYYVGTFIDGTSVYTLLGKFLICIILFHVILFVSYWNRIEMKLTLQNISEVFDMFRNKFR